MYLQSQFLKLMSFIILNIYPKMLLVDCSTGQQLARMLAIANISILEQLPKYIIT